MNILAIDPATTCGWAYRGSGGQFGGAWDLSIKRDESGGMRLIRFKAKLAEVSAAVPVDLVVYEAARNAGAKMQGALVVQATIQGVLVLWCEENGFEYRGYSPSEIKKHATGKGNANKEAMVKSAVARFGQVEDDNHADALWLADLAFSEYGGVKA